MLAEAGGTRPCGSRARRESSAHPTRTARASASSVAVSQACSASTMSGRSTSSVGDASGDETHPVGPAKPLRHFGIARPLVLAEIDAGEPDVDAFARQVPVGGEREISVAASEIDHVQRRREVGGKLAQERVDLPPLGRVAADHVEERVAGIEQMLLGPVVGGRLRRGDLTRPVHDRALLGGLQADRPVRGLHHPAAERLGEKLVDLGGVTGQQVDRGGALAVLGDQLPPLPRLDLDRAAASR